MTPETWYNEQLTSATAQLLATNQRIRTVSILRILFFLATIGIIIALWEEDYLKLLGCAAVTFIPFLGLLKVHNRLFERKQWLETAVALLKSELQGLHNDFSSFDDGKEFIDSTHNYSFDLDIFGPKFFRLLIVLVPRLVSKR